MDELNAPVEPVGESVDAPEQIVEQPTEQAPEKSAIERAFETVGIDEDGNDLPYTPAEGPKRGPDGKFIKADGEQPAEAIAEAPDAKKPEDKADEAPTRFTPDAKEAWKNADPALRGEMKRAIGELEGGLAKYQAEMAPLKQYADMAQQAGQTLPQALDTYYGLEKAMQENPIDGLNKICQSVGLTLEQVAAHVTGQTPDQKDTQRDQYIAGLEAKIGAFEKQLGSVQTTIKTQQETQTAAQVEEFASQPGRERFDELSPSIAQLLTTGMAGDLSQAYEMADRLNPAPQPAPAPAPEPQQAAQTRSNLSVHGAPDGGSNPQQRPRSKTPREAIQNAFSAAGIA